MDFYFKQVPLQSNKNPMPAFRAEGSIGYDLFAIEDGYIDPLSRKRIPLGFCSEFTPGYAGLLLDRSGMGNKGITKFAGVIDPNYRDEWSVILFNSNPSVFTFKAKDRLIQVVFVLVGLCQPLFGEGIVLGETERKGGFGSTGTTEELLTGLGKQNFIPLLAGMSEQQRRAVHEWAVSAHRVKMAPTVGQLLPEVPEFMKEIVR